MRYLVFVKHTEDIGDAPPALYAAMGEEMQAGFAAGSIVDAGGLAPTSQSTEIRLSGGEITTTNGPWAEAKEVVGGYSMLEARSHEEAVEGARRVIELHKEHWPGVEVAVEVRQVHGGSDG